MMPDKVNIFYIRIMPAKNTFIMPIALTAYGAINYLQMRGQSPPIFLVQILMLLILQASPRINYVFGFLLRIAVPHTI